MRRTVLFCVLLSAASLAVFWPVVHHEFVNYDDNCYVVQNPQVQAGLTWQGLAWAFGRLHGDHTYYHPLTWVSHMVDCQLFGLKPAGHHLVNLLFHILNSLLVFLVFKRMTGAFWRSAALASLFALHPLQVDTVAWIAERKNLLSASFFLLTLWAYARYAQAQGLKSKVQSPQSGVSGQGAVVSGQISGTVDHKPRPTDHGPRTMNHVSRFTFRAPRLHLPPSIFYLLSLFFFACRPDCANPCWSRCPSCCSCSTTGPCSAWNSTAQTLKNLKPLALSSRRSFPFCPSSSLRASSRPLATAPWARWSMPRPGFATGSSPPERPLLLCQVSRQGLLADSPRGLLSLSRTVPGLASSRLRLAAGGHLRPGHCNRSHPALSPGRMVLVSGCAGALHRDSSRRASRPWPTASPTCRSLACS